MALKNKIIPFLLLLFILSVVEGFIIPTVSAHDGVNLTIHMDETGFNPRELRIERGQKVVFENKSKDPRWPASNIHPTHDIYPEFDPKRVILPGRGWSFVFDRAGTWKMHDHLYPQFTGAVTVIETEARGPSIFTKIVSFFERLFPKRDTQYDPEIKKDSKAIFTDDKALYSYVKKFGAKATINRLHELEVQGVGDCHQRAHKAGRLSYSLIGNGTFKEIRTVECHSGYFHGVMEAFFKEKGSKDLVKNLRMICGNEKNPFLAHQCFHGIGHGLTAWSDYEIPESLRNCDLLPEGQGSCHSGVFMENVVGALALDDAKNNAVDLKDKHVSKYLSADLLYPCNAVEEKYQGTCYFFQTSRMMQIVGPDFAKIATTCDTIPENYKHLCFMSMGRDSSGYHQQDIQSTQKECARVTNKDNRIKCLTGAEEDLFWDPQGQDTALRFCALLTDHDEKKGCYETIFARAPQVLLSKEAREVFCEKSENTYQNLCRSYNKI